MTNSNNAPDDLLGELFERALDLPPEERDAFLDVACAGRPELRRELRSLLDSEETAPQFLEGLGERLLPRVFSRGPSDQPPDVTLATGRTVGRYTIIERLGAGGMGVVYKALDPELDRAVALKFLAPSPLGDISAQGRLRSEARAASALDHPNIAVVYEIGAVHLEASDPGDGRLYIAMAHYDGETLSRLLEQGPLAVSEALDLAIQLASGLSRAHEAGIVHRDIKPANLIVTKRGELKILDFGIARVAGGGHTRPGQPIGTVAYMSPEQTRGEAVDARSDVWSAGAVLFETLAGKSAFASASDGVTIHRIRHDAPDLVPLQRDEIPTGLLALIERCLSKDAHERPRDGSALHTELEAIRSHSDSTAPTAVEGKDPFLVVLPFANVSPEPENEYFSDGLTDEVITDLSHVRTLRVISRTSSMRLKGSELSVPEIARHLGVRYVVEGSVRKAGTALRITAQLVDAYTDTHLWAQVFDGTLDNIFQFQEEVAHAIVNALRIRLSPPERRAIAEHPIPHPGAYESYLRARYEAWRFSREGLARARRYIAQALDMVGDNALLFATLGHITAMEVDAGGNFEGVKRVEEYAELVATLDPASPRGSWLRSWAAFHRGDLATAITWGEDALAAQPDEPDTLLMLGYVYAHAGENAKATAFLKRALELDPLTPLTQGVQGFVPVLEGRPDEGVEPYRRHREMDPESPFAVVFVGWSLAYAGRIEEALIALDDASRRFPETAFGAFARSFAHGLRGNRALAVEAITQELEGAARHSVMFARELAHCYALAGEENKALDWLERAIELGMLNVPFLAEHDRFLDPLRSTPRFADLLRQARSASEAIGRVPGR